MISVCMATFNGEKFIKEQLDSILIQLGEYDEVIISDDSSTDNTLKIIENIKDKRIKVFSNQKFKSPTYNFENAIKQASGEIIFLSDQDDIWEPSKVKEFLNVFINDYKITLAISNIQLIDEAGNDMNKEFYKNSFTNKLLANIIKNNFIGCSMAFRKEVKNLVIPFPKGVAMHDWWIGICSIVLGEVVFIDKKLIYYRRHDNNVTKEVGSGLLTKLIWRINLLFNLIFRIIKLKL
jgi:glycosyltransferase involved in cell wall biosynthesis